MTFGNQAEDAAISAPVGRVSGRAASEGHGAMRMVAEQAVLIIVNRLKGLRRGSSEARCSHFSRLINNLQNGSSFIIRLLSLAVEHLLRKQKVVGSIPTGG